MRFEYQPDSKETLECHTHFAVPILSPSTRTHESVEPRFDTAAYDRVQTLVRGLVAAKEVQNM